MNIARAIKSGDMSTFYTSGVHLEGTKYQFLRQQENLFLAKKKDSGAISMQKSKTGECR